jgi:hypothetical protein
MGEALAQRLKMGRSGTASTPNMHLHPSDDKMDRPTRMNSAVSLPAVQQAIDHNSKPYGTIKGAGKWLNRKSASSATAWAK